MSSEILRIFTLLVLLAFPTSGKNSNQLTCSLEGADILAVPGMNSLLEGIRSDITKLLSGLINFNFEESFQICVREVYPHDRIESLSLSITVRCVAAKFSILYFIFDII